MNSYLSYNSRQLGYVSDMEPQDIKDHMKGVIFGQAVGETLGWAQNSC